MYRILVLGDGDMSYSLAMARFLADGEAEEDGHFSEFLDGDGGRDVHIVATTFLSMEQLNQRYGMESIECTVAALEELGVCVRHGVDATALHASFEEQCPRFSLVIFNYPHTGVRKIQLNRRLLRDFFISVNDVLDPDQGKVRVALLRGQGGTPADSDQRVDNWRVIENAAEGGFVLTSVLPFRAPLSYTCSGRRRRCSKFNLTGALVHEFRPPATQPSAVALFQPSYRHDISLWGVREEEYERKRILFAISQFSGHVHRVKFLEEMRVTPRDPSVGTKKTLSVLFRIIYKSQRMPLSRAAVNSIQQRLRESLPSLLGNVIAVR